METAGELVREHGDAVERGTEGTGERRRDLARERLLQARAPARVLPELEHEAGVLIDVLQPEIAVEDRDALDETIQDLIDSVGAGTGCASRAFRHGVHPPRGRLIRAAPDYYRLPGAGL